MCSTRSTGRELSPSGTVQPWPCSNMQHAYRPPQPALQRSFTAEGLDICVCLFMCHGSPHRHCLGEGSAAGTSLASAHRRATGGTLVSVAISMFKEYTQP